MHLQQIDIKDATSAGVTDPGGGPGTHQRGPGSGGLGDLSAFNVLLAPASATSVTEPSAWLLTLLAPAGVSAQRKRLCMAMACHSEPWRQPRLQGR